MAAKIVILPRNRLEWHKQMVLDVALSAVAVRVAIVIGGYFNNRTGKTFVGYERIAADLALSRATIAAAIKELKHRGHMAVESGGGRCVANEYRMVLNTVQNSGRYDDAETVQNQSLNRPESWTTTLKLPSEAISTGDKSRRRASRRVPQAVDRGSKGGSIFKIGSENWNAWLAHYRATGNKARVGVMLAAAERGRYREWSEVSDWPPPAVRRVAAIERAAE